MSTNTTPTDTPAASSTKLDAILYNFFSKSAALVLAKRLTHWQDEATASSTVNKWFALPLPDLGLFREELRLWRSISAFIPSAALEASVETPADEAIGAPGVHVPPMILDVILDPVQLTDRTDLRLVQLQSSSPGSSDAGHGQSQSTPSQSYEPLGAVSGAVLKPIVLERWRIDLNVFLPESPPDLQALYKRCTVHLQSLDSLISSLPTTHLFERLARAKATSDTVSPADDLQSILQIGCRLDAAEPEDTNRSQEEVTLRTDFPGKEGSRTARETGLHGFPPIICPVGSLNVSVEYRQNVAFEVQNIRDKDAGVRRKPATSVEAPLLTSEELRPDEDYFKPQKAQQAVAELLSPAPNTSAMPKISALTAMRKTSETAVSTPTKRSDSTASPSSLDRSPIPSPGSSRTLSTGASAANRPVAGLSGFRHQGTFVMPTTSSDTPPLSSSPGIGEPAFLTNHARRVSSSSAGSSYERRFRALSSYGSGTAANVASSFGDRSNSPLASAAPTPPSTNMAGVPIRPTLSGQLRLGSYSPSSPSPLAQQLASAGTGSGFSSQHLRTVDSQASTTFGSRGRLASFAGGQTPDSSSKSLTLRNIFQQYVPKDSTSSSHRMSVVNRSPISSAHSISPLARQHQSSPRPRLNRNGSTESSSGDAGVSTSRNSSEIAAVASSSVDAAGTMRKPSVSPQMIQRYSRTPSYRRDPQQRSAGDGSSDVALSGQDDIAGSAGSYSRSWQARTEARQQAAAMMAAAGTHRGSFSGYSGASFLPRAPTGSTGSSGSMRSRGSPGGLLNRESPPVAERRSQDSPQQGQRGSVDELMAMIESRPALQSAGFGSTGQALLSRQSQNTSPPSLDSGDRLRQSRGLAGSPSTVVLSASAMDEMLARMSHSVSRLTLPVAPVGRTSASGTPSRSTFTSTPVERRGDLGHSASRQPALLSDTSDYPSRDASVFSKEQATGKPGPREFSPADETTTIEGGAGALLFAPATDASTRVPSRCTGFEVQSSSRDASSHVPSRPAHSGRTESDDTFAQQEDDEEEPAGRMELHSDPATPTLERTAFAHRPSIGLVRGCRDTDMEADLSADEGRGTVGEGLYAPLADLRRPRSAASHHRAYQQHRQQQHQQQQQPPLPLRHQVGEGHGDDIDDAERLRSFGEELSSVRGRRGGAGPALYHHHAHQAVPTHRQHFTATSLRDGNGGFPSSTMQGAIPTQSAGTSPWRSRKSAGASSSVGTSPVGSPGRSAGTAPLGPIAAFGRRPAPSVATTAATQNLDFSSFADEPQRISSRRSSPRRRPEDAESGGVVGGGGGDALSPTLLGGGNPRVLQTQQRQQAQQTWWDYQSQRERDV